MQVLSPTALAPGACGFSATWALAKPGAGRGRLPRSVPSVERFVDGSELAISSREGCDWPTATVHTRTRVQAMTPAPTLTAIGRFNRPRVIPFSPHQSIVGRQAVG